MQGVLCGKDEGYVASHSVDDSLLAFGTSLVGVINVTIDDDDHASRIAQVEVAGGQGGDVQSGRGDDVEVQNAAQILELHSARGGRHGDLLQSTNKFNTYLNGADGWLFLDKCDIATLEEMECWWDGNNRSSTEEMYTVFYAAKCEYTLEKDQDEMEEGPEPPQPSGGNTDGEGNNEDDHHIRWLPTKYQMEIVMKNENEAKELSSGENYHGAARYAPRP